MGMTLFFLTACPSLESKPEPKLTTQGVVVSVGSSGPAAVTGHSFEFFNNCDETVWVGAIGNPGFPVLNGGGWEMLPQAHQSVDVAVGWSGRFWPRTGCTFDASGNGTCLSGSCLEADNKTFGLLCGYSGTPPASLVEPTLDAPSGNGPYDVYDVSFVDGWSVPVSVLPVAGTFNPEAPPGLQAPWCTLSGCSDAPVCPGPYVLPGSPNSCLSPCQADPSDKNCCSCSLSSPITCPEAACSGAYGCSPYSIPPNPVDMTCDPWNKNTSRAWSDLAQSYISAVKTVCPNVYSWQFDDTAGTFNCAKTGGLVDYTVTFCPESEPATSPVK